jgi:hypothetical protein
VSGGKIILQFAIPWYPFTRPTFLRVLSVCSFLPRPASGRAWRLPVPASQVDPFGPEVNACLGLYTKISCLLIIPAKPSDIWLSIFLETYRAIVGSCLRHFNYCGGWLLGPAVPPQQFQPKVSHGRRRGTRRQKKKSLSCGSPIRGYGCVALGCSIIRRLGMQRP